jgi:MoaA/NifB/PqqE/SkfB family radical SAM enzyme/SAM-dependent methyltransferase
VKALIKVGYGCNENCTFCHTLEYREVNGESEDVHRKIDRAKQLGHSMVVLSGGEPTLRKELFDWASHVARLGMDFGLVTNGLLLAYPDVVERLLSARMKYVYMSLHGGTPQVHQRVVRADTHGVALKALGNLTGKGLDLTVNAVLVKQNLEDLKQLVDVLAPFEDAVIKFSMLQPKGGGKALFDAITPKVSDVAARVNEAIAHGLAKGLPRTRFVHDGLPFCLLPGFEDRYDDLKTHQFATMIETDEGDFHPVDDVAKVQPEPCLSCALRGACPGLYRGYHEAFGHAELRTVTQGARSNSFNYTLEAVAPAPANGQCLLLGPTGVTPWDRARHLFIAHDGKIARYRTKTRDFADVELAQVKHERAQVYFDASRAKDAPDDFARDLVPLKRSALCVNCAERERCTGLYEPVFEDVFSRDDQRVRELLRGLTGRVLDVGCGEGPYDDVLSELGPRVEYVGVDPSASAIERLKKRRAWGTHHVGAAEDLSALQLGAFDTVLVLRSWNHLRDLPRAVESFRAALKPDGTLLVVDNEAFGLARSTTQTRRGETSRAEFEHYRNHSAEAALRTLSAFTLLERRDVAPGTSNQWLLRLTR